MCVCTQTHTDINRYVTEKEKYIENTRKLGTQFVTENEGFISLYSHVLTFPVAVVFISILNKCEQEHSCFVFIYKLLIFFPNCLKNDTLGLQIGLTNQLSSIKTSKISKF